MHWKIAISIAFFLSTSTQAQVIEYVEGMRLGQGYDFINGQVRNNDCVEPTDPQKITYPAVSSSFLYEEITNSESMRRFLQVDAASTYNAATSNGGGKAEFVNSSASASSTSSFSFRHIVSAAETSADHWDYSSAKDSIGKDPNNFRSNCGTHFIKAIVDGGELYGTITQSIRSEDERNAFKSTASAAFTTMKANIGVETALEKSSYASTLKIEGRKTGGSNLLNLHMDEFRKTFMDFRSEVGMSETHPITVFLAEYPVPPTTVKFIALEESANLLLRYRDTGKQLDSIESDPAIYYVDEKISPSIVNEIRTLLRNNKNLLVATMEKCKLADEKNASSLCDLSRVSLAYPPALNQLAKTYKSTCGGVILPSPLEDGSFLNLPRVSGDSSMGGQDVAAATIQYSGVAGGLVKRNIKLRIVETRPNYTQYAKESDSVVWSESMYPGCTLGSSFDEPAEDVGSRFPLMGDGATAVNDYIALPYENSKYLITATCRSNQQGEDDGFVGCRSFAFRPIQIDLRHVELKTGNPPPLSIPTWLSNPSPLKTNAEELRSSSDL